MAQNDGTRPGWFRDGQPAGMERYWNGHSWEGAPRPVQRKQHAPQQRMPEKQRRTLTVAGLIFIAVFVLVQGSAGEIVGLGTLLLILSPFILIGLVLWLLWRAGNKHETVVAPAATVQTPTGVMAPGWYPDQLDQTLNRWWDGQQWTSATLPK